MVICDICGNPMVKDERNLVLTGMVDLYTKKGKTFTPTLRIETEFIDCSRSGAEYNFRGDICKQCMVKYIAKIVNSYKKDERREEV